MSSTRDAAGGTSAGAVSLDGVVVGVDFTAPSIEAVDWVRKRILPETACVLVHALEVPQPPQFLKGAFPARDEFLASAREGATSRLERLREQHGWGDVRLEVREGRAENVMAAVAEENGADLVVVGEHTRPRAIWTALGSTAEALVRCSPVPVLLARNAPDHVPERILVAVDASEPARAALAWARALRDRHGAAVTAVHVFRPVYVGVAQAVSGMATSRDLEERQFQQAEEWLEGLVREAGFGQGEADTRVESGDPASELVAIQRGGDFDLVIIGSHGLGGVGRMLIGSVATAVLRGASCPVLVLRGRR